MRKIVKRYQTVDPRGRVLARNTERLADDGYGRVSLATRTVAARCSGCGRFIGDLSELRGYCDYCRRRACCIQCETRCQVCSRRLCVGCRRGFVGQAAMTVCPICLFRLRRRQAFLDRYTLEKAAFERRMFVQRERAHLQTLYLQAERMRIMAQLQAARMRMMGQLAVMREINRLKLALFKARPFDGRYLR